MAVAPRLYAGVDSGGPMRGRFTALWEAVDVANALANPLPSLGALLIQFATLSRFSHINATASSRNEPLLKSLGVTPVLGSRLSLEDLLSAVSSITTARVETVYNVREGLLPLTYPPPEFGHGHGAAAAGRLQDGLRGVAMGLKELEEEETRLPETVGVTVADRDRMLVPLDP
ncbi:hypothetical protein GLOTRDRAFT_93438 [Gloeophyllum trabeum ATCC 11539]|uniref:Uncharacterized protein n=1 Tax=Gloeophyllum trabeum (strain ATCC 11539 / FP-39264 / Madison 617) TaxID=670483 RepID=S7Q7D1_GLOTA|nr:uncharacterized protein GLOTRDRAFT_93438 [Gloeophyllum trabeum ATCC 11539]EPQ55916.1 hypothetical protein GLOTRDRAFT_93438 [Gloeophyllum trabeum ATCC 11539]